MIKKYRFGTPIETNAVVKEIEIEKGNLPYFACTESENVYEYAMEESDMIYGLGENVRGINKRGWIYESYCADDGDHSEHKNSLYGAHNFLVVDGEETFGVFFDYPGFLTFDIGYTKMDKMKITASEANLDIYIIEGEDVLSITKEFRGLIGRSYIPPKWAFGYGQSRWGYKNEEDIRKVVEGHRANQLPLDMVYMDIDYMERYKDFTVDKNAFSDLTALSKELKEEGIRLIPIIDAGVKIEKGYEVYEEGVANHYFCKEENGDDFVGAVWPGKVHFPDTLNADTRKWFGSKYKVLLDQGIEGFWNDMNEPAIFYSEKRYAKVKEQLATFKENEEDATSFFEFIQLPNTLMNNIEDYKTFYHNIDGKKVRHDKVHNLYGYNMTRAAGEAFEELEPNKRLLLFSRASYIGMHRYGGIWTGDNHAVWGHLLLNIKMMPSLNMCGFLYSGADIGGFGKDTTEDLLLRWIAFGIFTPLMRNHAAHDTREQEAYQFTNKDIFRDLLGIRYGFLPYFYSEYMKAALRDDLYFKPLSFEYKDDKMAKQIEDQLLVGDSIMIAPVYNQNATGRYVYLPEEMKAVKMKSMETMTFEILQKGHHYVEVGLDEIIFFIRPQKAVPYTKVANHVEALDEKNLSYLSFGEGAITYELYQDDGISKDYENPKNIKEVQIENKEQ